MGRQEPSEATPRKGDITQLLDRWSHGDSDAAKELLPLVYDELHRIAESYFHRERANHTLQATAIVHEAYMSLIDQHGISLQNRAHFIGYMAHVMRRVLVDHARSRNSEKRGGKAYKVTLVEAASLSTDKTPDIAVLDDALTSLAQIDRQKATLVELRFFGGLSVDEAADVIGISRTTAIREWRRTRAWLYRELNSGTTPP